MIAYLDASAVIYAVEGTSVWAEALKRELRQQSSLHCGSAAVMVTGDADFQRVPALRLALLNGDGANA